MAKDDAGLPLADPSVSHLFFFLFLSLCLFFGLPDLEDKQHMGVYAQCWVPRARSDVLGFCGGNSFCGRVLWCTEL